jgi:hypothetical protein
MQILSDLFYLYSWIIKEINVKQVLAIIGLN